MLPDYGVGEERVRMNLYSCVLGPELWVTKATASFVDILFERVYVCDTPLTRYDELIF